MRVRQPRPRRRRTSPPARSSCSGLGTTLGHRRPDRGPDPGHCAGSASGGGRVSTSAAKRCRRSAGWAAGCSATSPPPRSRSWSPRSSPTPPGRRCPGRPWRGLHRLQQRLAAVPDALRDRRHLGHHRPAAPDERARRRWRSLDLVRDDFSAGVRLASVIVVPCSLVLAVLGPAIGRGPVLAHGSTSSPARRYLGDRLRRVLPRAAARTWSSSSSCGCSTRCTTAARPALIGLATMALNIAANYLALARPAAPRRGGRPRASASAWPTWPARSSPGSILSRRLGGLDGAAVTQQPGPDARGHDPGGLLRDRRLGHGRRRAAGPGTSAPSSPCCWAASGAAAAVRDVRPGVPRPRAGGPDRVGDAVVSAAEPPAARPGLPATRSDVSER